MKRETPLGIKVGDIMTRNFVSAEPNIPVLDAVDKMVKNRVGNILIQENKLLKGILTEKDIMWALNKKKDLSNVIAWDICTRKITTIRPSADISEALVIMRKAKFRRLPVTINKKVIGILTMKDILKIQPELFEIAKEGYRIRDYEEKIKRLRKIESGEEIKEGLCENCGKFDILYNLDERLICPHCREKM
jgi:CBS domain-containing protein